MFEATKREIALMPVVAAMERRGINLDGAKLKQDTDKYWGHLDKLDDSIQQYLGQSIDIDSNASLADAIERAGKSKGFATTPTGKRSTSKSSLTEAIDDPELLGMLLIRGALATSLRTFLQPWLVQYEQQGRLYLRLNQFRNYSDTGARTGRLSSSPNLQNVPVEWEGLLAQLAKVGYKLPFELPNIRQYLIPDSGKIFVGGDYSSQEMRLLAHFAGGKLLEQIQKEPRNDIHQIAAGIAGVTRRVAKTLGFATLYGAGVGRISESLGISISEATSIKARYLAALPEIKRFSKEVTDKGKAGNYIETLGGRQYKTDPTVKVINGRPVTFEYKLVNYLIQGSAADQSKQAMLNYAATNEGELVLMIHDQLIAQVPIGTSCDVIEKAMTDSFQETLRYQVIVETSSGMSYAEL